MWQLMVLLITILLSSCAWQDRMLRDLAMDRQRWAVPPAYWGGSGYSLPSQSFEFYDPAGRHLGYGSVSGGTVNIYAPDGSRLGYGGRR